MFNHETKQRICDYLDNFFIGHCINMFTGIINDPVRPLNNVTTTTSHYNPIVQTTTHIPGVTEPDNKIRYNISSTGNYSICAEDARNLSKIVPKYMHTWTQQRIDILSSLQNEFHSLATDNLPQTFMQQVSHKPKHIRAFKGNIPFWHHMLHKIFSITASRLTENDKQYTNTPADERPLKRVRPIYNLLDNNKRLKSKSDPIASDQSKDYELNRLYRVKTTRCDILCRHQDKFHKMALHCSKFLKPSSHRDRFQTHRLRWHKQYTRLMDSLLDSLRHNNRQYNKRPLDSSPLKRYRQEEVLLLSKRLKPLVVPTHK